MTEYLKKWNVGAVEVGCPACGGALPDVPVTATAAAAAGPTAVNVALTADLTAGWWARVRLAHPRCIGGRDDSPVEAAA